MLNWIYKVLEKTKNATRDAYLWNGGSAITMALQSPVILAVANRTNGAEDAGIYSIAIAVANLMLFLGQYGLRRYQSSDIKQDFSFSEYHAVRLITCSLMMISCLAYCIFGVIFRDYSRDKFIIVYMVCLIKTVQAYADVLHGHLQQRGRLDIACKASVVRYLAELGTYVVVLIVAHNMVLAVSICLPVTLGLLMITILGHMIAGANTGDTIDLTLSALYTQMVLELWGSAGGILFNIALITAALTTAVGAVSSTSEIWEEILHEKNEKLFTYKNFCIASCALSCVVSFADLDTIVKVIGPVLDACYPPAIVIAMYYCLCRRPERTSNLRAGKWAVIGSFVVSVIQLAVRYSEMFSLGWDKLSSLYYALPLAEYSLAWLPVSLILILASFLTGRQTSAQE